MPSLESLDHEFEEFKKDHPVILLETTGSKMEFSVCGKGEKTILLFHGLAGNAHSVYRFVTALEKKYKVVCPTIPIFKGSVNDVCAAIEGHLFQMDITPSIVIGGSFGGLLAQAFWYRNLTTIDRVIIFDSMPPDKKLGRRNQRASKVLSVLPWVLLRPLFRVRLLRLFRVATKLSQDQIALLTFGRSQFLERFKSLSKELLVSHSNLSFDFILNCSIPVLSNWNGKLLVIYSLNDPATRNGSLLFQTAYPFAKMVGIENAEHLGSLLHFEQYIAEIKSVLE